MRKPPSRICGVCSAAPQRAVTAARARSREDARERRVGLALQTAPPITASLFRPSAPAVAEHLPARKAVLPFGSAASRSLPPAAGHGRRDGEPRSSPWRCSPHGEQPASNDAPPARLRCPFLPAPSSVAGALRQRVAIISSLVARKAADAIARHPHRLRQRHRRRHRVEPDRVADAARPVRGSWRARPRCAARFGRLPSRPHPGGRPAPRRSARGPRTGSYEATRLSVPARRLSAVERHRPRPDPPIHLGQDDVHGEVARQQAPRAVPPLRLARTGEDHLEHRPARRVEHRAAMRGPDRRTPRRPSC